MQVTRTEGPRTFIAGEDLLAYRRVKIKTGTVMVPPEVEYADAGEAFIGITEDNRKSGESISVRLLNGGGTFIVQASKSIALGAVVYGAVDGKVSDASSGFGYFIALKAAVSALDYIEVILNPVLATAAGAVGIADAGNFTAAATVEAALQEIYQHLKSVQKILPLPANAWTLKTGVQMAVFADGASTTPGWSATDKTAGIRWNNHATPAAIKTSFPVPMDADLTADMVLHILAHKSGATVGDAVTFTVEAFNNVVGATFDADADYGGVSSAMVGDALAKTVQELTLALAAANLPASQATITLTLKPTDGTLGADDVTVSGIWLEYKGKCLAA